MVDPTKMCRKHLLGEHVELHMLVGSLNGNRSVTGFLNDGLVAIHLIQDRHEELAIEMQRRGWKHRSDLLRFTVFKAGEIDVAANITELKRRCADCRILLSRP